MNLTVFTAIFTAITAIAALIAAGIALWIACTEQWRQEKHRQKILNSQKCDLILVPMKEYNAGEQYQALSNELYGLKATNKFFQERVTLLLPSELYWLDSERIYGVDIKPDFLVNEAKIQYENTRYFKEILVTARGKKHDKHKNMTKDEIKSDKKENQTLVIEDHDPKKENEKYGASFKKDHERKDEEERKKITDEMTQKEEDNSVVTVEKATNNWLEIMAKFASVLTVLIPTYTFLMLWATEQYLEKYHINHINAQLPSKSLMLQSIIAAEIAIGTVLVWNLFKVKKPHKIVRWGLRIIIVFVFWTSWFVVKTLPLNALTFDNVKALLQLRIGHFQLVTIITMMTVICILAIKLLKTIFSISQVPIMLQILGILPVMIIGAIALIWIINKDVKTLPTIHIQAKEEMEVWEDNIPIADDGKQIWAVVYENSEYYFAEPIDISRSGDSIDTTHVITLEKADVILYTETVEQVLSKYKKPCGLNNP